MGLLSQAGLERTVASGGEFTCDPSSSYVETIDLKEQRNASFGKWSPNATIFSQFKNLVEIDLSNNMIQMNGYHMLQGNSTGLYMECM